MKKLFFLLLFLSAILRFPAIYGFEVPDIDVISNRQGLPSDKITAMCQDKRGFVWIATQEGLCRYDGYEIKNYKNLERSDSLIFGKNINCLLINNKQMLFIGTSDGLFIFDTFREVFTPFANNILSSSEINCLVEDGRSLWIGTNNGLNRYYYKTGDVSVYKHTYNDISHLQSREIRCLRKDLKGDIWISYKSKGFSRYDAGSNKFIHYPEVKKGLLVCEFSFDGNDIYVGTWGAGIYKIEGDPESGDVKYIKSNIEGLFSGIIYMITKDDQHGYYWIGMPKGLFIVDDLINPSYTQRISSGFASTELSNEEARYLFYDKTEQNIWIGTEGGGINRISLSPLFIHKYNMANVKRLFNSNTVTSIYDHGENLWIGVKSVGLVIYNKKNKEYSLYKEDPVLRNISADINSINVIVKLRSRNEIWLGSRYDGVWIVSLDDQETPVKVSRLSDVSSGSTSVWETSSIYEDNEGNVWIGGWDGLRLVSVNSQGKLTSEHISSARNRYSLPNSAITGITQASNGEVWIATADKGVYCVSMDSNSMELPVFTRVPIQVASMTHHKTSTIFCDAQSRIWVGIPGAGLALYDPEKGLFIRVSSLLSEIGTVYSVIESSKGSLWIGTNQGIYNYQDSIDEPKLFNFTYNDGLTENIFLHNSVCKGEDNTLYFGGYNGLSSLKLDKYSLKPNNRTPVITDIKVFDESILRDYSKSGSYTVYNEDGDIENVIIEAKDYGIRFEFSSLSFNNSYKNKYRYMLEGYDNQWLELSNGQHSVQYNNLPSGRYVFKLMATNDSGIWSNTIVSFDVVVKPPLYATVGAWCVYILLLIIVVIIIIKSVISKIRLHNSLMIAKIDKQKTEDLNNAKLQFFTNVSHELLTPLSIISYGIDDFKKSNPENLFIHKILKGNVERLMRLLEQILEFRKADTGNLQLKVSFGDIAHLINQIASESFLPLIDKKRLILNVECKPSQIYGWFDKDKIDKIIYNLLSNAFKYNVEHGTVDVQILANLGESKNEYSSVTIKVTNSGEVIDQKRLENLFIRFYDGEYRKFSTKGFGIGLALTKDLVQLHKGNISVSSSVEEGTCFTIELPLLKSMYDEKEISVSEDVNQSETDIVLSDSEHIYLDGEPILEESLKDEKPTVLLVEDDDELSVIMRSALSKLYKVISAANGVQGLSLARKYNPDIIISDIIMPVMNGYEMCSELKRDINISHIPVILLTAKVAVDDEVKGLDVGADAYMTKPTQVKLLYAQVNSLINNRKLVLEKFKQPDLNIDLSQVSTLDDQFLHKAISIVEENLDNTEFEIKEFLDKMNVTNSMLYRKLKSLTGLSPNEFIRNIRLKAAYRIIQEKAGRVSISEVAYMVGFNTPKYFAACFKKEFGYLPSQLLEQLEGENNESE